MKQDAVKDWHDRRLQIADTGCEALISIQDILESDLSEAEQMSEIKRVTTIAANQMAAILIKKP